MNFRNKYLLVTLRSLFGLLMLFSGVAGLLAGKSMEGVPEPMIPITQALWDSGIFHMIKVTEIVAGLMLLLGFLPALAAIFLAPIAVGVVVFNALLAPAYVPTGLVLCLFEAYLGYAYWDKYKALFQRR
ncbi:MAG: DoxX family membrane protein [Nanoarchaeota archaeon]|nr:DoxX family membrane protein [Nanoarchaeota archaeon]